MTIHIPIQNGFAQRLVLYKTIENSNTKTNSKILLSKSTILICVRTRYHKVESENRNCFRLTIYCVISIHLHGNINKNSFFHLNIFLRWILEFHWENCIASVLHGELESQTKRIQWLWKTWKTRWLFKMDRLYNIFIPTLFTVRSSIRNETLFPSAHRI